MAEKKWVILVGLWSNGYRPTDRLYREMLGLTSKLGSSPLQILFFLSRSIFFTAHKDSLLFLWQKNTILFFFFYLSQKSWQSFRFGCLKITFPKKVAENRKITDKLPWKRVKFPDWEANFSNFFLNLLRLPMSVFIRSHFWAGPGFNEDGGKKLNHHRDVYFSCIFGRSRQDFFFSNKKIGSFLSFSVRETFLVSAVPRVRFSNTFGR